jgi:iron complex transport system ATP-binding protein
VIELGDISVELGNTLVLDGVSFGVADGEWVMVVGPNGAGKSTLLRAVAGLVDADGEIRIGGVATKELARRELAQRVALVPQIPFTPAGMTVGEYVLLGRTPFVSYFGREGKRDLAATGRALRRLDLVALTDRPLGSLSGGERQRAVLARALTQDARVLLLDEPTTALDAGRQQDVLELVDELRLEEELTILSAMHDLTLALQYPQRVVLLDRGRVVTEGAPGDVLTAERIAEHYRASVRIVEGAVVPVRAR